MSGNHNMYCSGNQPGLVERLREEAQDDPDSMYWKSAEEIERLHQICRDAYEVWAGSEGIPEPETCAEAYLHQLLIQMRDEVKRGL